jgi:hypothetical protein
MLLVHQVGQHFMKDAADEGGRRGGLRFDVTDRPRNLAPDIGN